jgi:hydrogenase maturation protease
MIERLEREYDFSDNVTLMDGGTLGMKLMDPIINSDYLIVVDAVLGDSSPGSVYRLTGEDLRRSLAFNDSMHQTDLVDTLVYCDLLGNRPEAVIVGMEPQDYQTMATDLSESSRRNASAMISAILKEVEQAGGTWREIPEHNRKTPEEISYVPGRSS